MPPCSSCFPPVRSGLPARDRDGEGMPRHAAVALGAPGLGGILPGPRRMGMVGVESRPLVGLGGGIGMAVHPAVRLDGSGGRGGLVACRTVLEVLLLALELKRKNPIGHPCDGRPCRKLAWHACRGRLPRSLDRPPVAGNRLERPVRRVFRFLLLPSRGGIRHNRFPA